MALNDHPVTVLELSGAIAGAEAKAREELKETVAEVKDDLRRDIKLYVGLGVAGGNALVALVTSYLGPHAAAQATAHVLRAVLPV